VYKLDFESIRNDFPALEEWTYLDNAFVGLFPKQVKQGYDNFVSRWYYFTPDEGKTILAEWLEKADKVRTMVATLIGTNVNEVAFTTCTGSGLNIVINGLSWEAGDNVVFPDWEHNPLYTHTLKDKGVECRSVKVSGGRVELDDILEAMDRKTKLIQISQVGYINGFRFDLEKVASLAHDFDAKVLVDATQAVGALKVDYRKDNVDFVSFAPYKYLMGPAGLAILYVKSEHISELKPDRVGWKNQLWRGERAEDPRDLTTAEKFEYGTINFQGVYALEQSLEYLERVGISNVEKRVLSLSSYLWKNLVDEGKELYSVEGTESPIVSFYQENAIEIAAKLMKEKIKVTGRGAHGSHIRTSVHFYNDKNDIDTLMSKI